MSELAEAIRIDGISTFGMSQLIKFLNLSKHSLPTVNMIKCVYKI